MGVYTNSTVQNTSVYNTNILNFIPWKLCGNSCHALHEKWGGQCPCSPCCFPVQLLPWLDNEQFQDLLVII